MLVFLVCRCSMGKVNCSRCFALARDTYAIEATLISCPCCLFASDNGHHNCYNHETRYLVYITGDHL